MIDTIEDFIENGKDCWCEFKNIDSIRCLDMYWGSYHLYEDLKNSLKLSADPAYQELLRRIKVFKDRSDAEAGLKTGRYGVYGGISNKKYFVTFDWNEQLRLLKSYRLMKKTCIFNYYSVFALQKFSPYTELFSNYALK